MPRHKRTSRQKQIDLGYLSTTVRGSSVGFAVVREPGHMTTKPGQRGYLLLSDSFSEPRWREALIIAVEENWLKTIVKCDQEEINKSGLTGLEHAGGWFCMVEAQAFQLRVGVTGESLALGVSGKQLLEVGKRALESADEEMMFATASEPHLPARSKAKAGPKREGSAASEESSGESSAEEEDVLKQMRKKWLGDGTASERKQGRSKEKKSGKRFSMLERHRTSNDKDKVDTNALLTAAAQSDDPLRGLLALQLAKASRSKKKSRRRSSSTSSSRSEDSGRTSSSSSDRGKSRGYAKAIRSYQDSKKKMFRRPLHYVKRYIRSVERELGAEDRPYRLTDYSRKIHFGKQQNLKRCHFLLSATLEMLLKEDYKKAALQMTLILQAMHQVALDGNWEVGWLLTCMEDPYKPKVFGGDPANLQHITGYLKSMSELAKSTEALRRKGGGKGDEDSPNQKEAPKGKGRNHGSQKQKDKDKDKEKVQAE